jgi:hypothetical protein
VEQRRIRKKCYQRENRKKHKENVKALAAQLTELKGIVGEVKQSSQMDNSIKVVDSSDTIKDAQYLDLNSDIELNSVADVLTKHGGDMHQAVNELFLDESNESKYHIIIDNIACPGNAEDVGDNDDISAIGK